MGDRVLIGFRDNFGFAPTIYMHWAGEQAETMIREGQHLMRKDDASYAAGRFCGYCATKTTGGLGLLDAFTAETDFEKASHGDAGVYVVNVSTGEVQHGGGYGKPFKLDPDAFAA